MLGAEYRVLGPLEVFFDGRQIVVPAGKGRVLLATLLLRPNRFVSVDELVERLWDGSPPSIDRAVKTLHMTVARLRRALGPANCVVTATNGYLAEVGDRQLDLLRFRALARTDPHAALALWHEPVLADVVSEALHREDVLPLAEERLLVLERRIDADLDADFDKGRAAEVVAELRALTARYPLRERFWAQLMTALYRSGQRAAALAAFDEVGRMLADDLGIDPGPALRELHASVLREEALPGRREVVVPRQLPSDLARFSGRAADLAGLDRLLPQGDAGQAVVISAIAGSAGVGKTALAVHWAHRVRDRFPDGQLAVNLRGYDREEPLTPHDALGQLLRGLGLSSKEIPEQTRQRVERYRALLADRRVLVLLDNARSAEQVRPLLPGGGRSVAVVTSRSDLSGLGGARLLRLGVLPLDDAVRLLEDVIGAEHTRSDPDATRELARLCACLPLALRIAASMVTVEPRTGVRELVDRLSTGDRLAELEVEDDREAAVRAAFDLSHAALAPDEQRLFRVLGLAPRADFTPMSAGALLGVPSGRALALLRRLTRAHLVEEHAPLRFSQHDLLRLHARERAAAEDGADQRHAAVVRFLDHHLHTADQAERAIRRNRHDRSEKPLTERDPVVEVVEFADAESAFAWCRREHDLLVELCEFALAEGHLEHAWKLVSCLWGYLQAHGSSSDFLHLFGIALDAARRLGDRAAEAMALQHLGTTHRKTDRFDESLPLLTEALRIRRELGDHRTIAAAHAELGGAHFSAGDHAESLRHDRAAGEHWQLAGDEPGWARSMNNVAYTLVHTGDYAAAAAIADEAAAVYARYGMTAIQFQNTRAVAKYRSGDLDGAVALYRGLLAHPDLDRIGTFARVGMLVNAAHALREAGDRDQALWCARKALNDSEQGGLTGADKISELIRDLEA